MFKMNPRRYNFKSSTITCRKSAGPDSRNTKDESLLTLQMNPFGKFLTLDSENFFVAQQVYNLYTGTKSYQTVFEIIKYKLVLSTAHTHFNRKLH